MAGNHMRSLSCISELIKIYFYIFLVTVSQLSHDSGTCVDLIAMRIFFINITHDFGTR